MPLLKSLICLKGYDNGRRFLLISLACYLLLVILSPLFKQAVILTILFTAISLPAITTSSLRRIHDAGFATPLAAIPILIYLINLFAIPYIEHSSRWALLVLAVITTTAMATISNARARRKHNYQMGYYGPISLENDEKRSTQYDRIEPTIAGKKTVVGTPDLLQSIKQAQLDEAAIDHDSIPQPPVLSTTDQQSYNSHTSHQQSPQKTNWEQQLGVWFNTNRKVTGIILTTLLLITIIALLLPLFDNEVDTQIPQQPVKTAFVKSRLNKVEMPDQFWIMLDQNNALTIGWEGAIKTKDELGDKGSYWTAFTGQGDKDCTNLNFSLGESIKTLLVTVKNNGDYYADFSPVDTKLIVRSIAEKDRFQLCGYEFILKGTGNRLRKNKTYAQYLK